MMPLKIDGYDDWEVSVSDCYLTRGGDAVSVVEIELFEPAEESGFVDEEGATHDP